MPTRPMTLREIFEENHPMFVELGRETAFFITWIGDLNGNIEIESLNERSEHNPHKILTMKPAWVQVHAEEFGWTIEVPEGESS